MGSKKYKVQQNGQFLGYWSAHSAIEAIEKAVKNYGQYYNIDTNDWFDVSYGTNSAQIYVGETNEG